MTVRTRAFAFQSRPAVRKTSEKSRKTLRGYTHVSTRPDSLPKIPARCPMAQRNSHGRAERVSCNGFFVSASGSKSGLKAERGTGRRRSNAAVPSARQMPLTLVPEKAKRVGRALCILCMAGVPLPPAWEQVGYDKRPARSLAQAEAGKVSPFWDPHAASF